MQIKKHPFYLKGKYNYLTKYNEEVEDIEDEFNTNENIIEKHHSTDNKNYSYTSIRKKQGDAYDLNKNKTLKVNKDKKFKNNIY